MVVTSQDSSNCLDDVEVAVPSLAVFEFLPRPKSQVAYIFLFLSTFSNIVARCCFHCLLLPANLEVDASLLGNQVAVDNFDKLFGRGRQSSMFQLDLAPSKLVITTGIFVTKLASQDHVVEGRQVEGKFLAPFWAVAALGAALLHAVVLVSDLS